MAIGGPYTDQALSKAPIPLSELIGGGQQPAPDMGEGLSPDMGLPRLMQDDTAGFDPVVAPENAPLPGAAAPDSSVAEQGAAPSPGQREPTMAEQERQRPRIGGMRRGVERAPWNQNYRYTQEDFYGTDNPNITFTDPRGVQLYVPQAGRLPMNIWASQMQQAQGELAKTRKAMADLLDQTQAPQTAPPYQQDFNRLFYGMRDNQVSGLAKQYGGDRTLALQEIATPGTEANMKYRRTMADAEALATFMKYEWEDASSWIKEVSEGKYEPYPEMRKTAEEVVHGLGSLKSDTVSGGDAGKLMQNIGKLRRDMALAKFTDEFLRPNAANLYQKTKEIIDERVKRGQVRTESLTEQNIQDEFYKVAADEYARFAPGADKKRAIEFFKAMFPADKEHLHEVKYANLPKPNGDSGAGAAKERAWVGTIEEGPSATSPWREGSTAAGARVQRLPIGKVVDGRREQFPVRRFTGKVDGKTQEVEMLPTYIERRSDGEFYVSGLWMQRKTRSTERVSDADDDGSLFSSSASGREGTFEDYIEKGPISVPVKGNEAMIESMLGGLDWKAQFKGAPSQPSAKSGAKQRAGKKTIKGF